MPKSTTGTYARGASLPNLLTYGRIAAVPALAAALFFSEGAAGRWAAFVIFFAASVTDWLDGYLARALAQQSELGRMLDPIADKLLVAATLLMLVRDGTIGGWTVWAALIILCREILVSGLREFLAGLNVQVHVTRLAKFKTAVQLAALAALLAGPAAGALAGGLTGAGLTLLWIAALLTLWTGYSYLKVSITAANGHGRP